MTPDTAKSLANDLNCVICTLQAIADELSTAFSDNDFRDYADNPEEPAQTEPAPKSTKAPTPITLEQIRTILSSKAANGKREKVKNLLTKYGSAQLSAVKPENYPALLADAEAL